MTRDHAEPIQTPSLALLPATVTLLEAELASLDELGHRLGATVPPGWPPGEYDRGAAEFFLDRLRADPGAAGWYGWYAIARPPDGHATLIGAAGYFGPPTPEGVVEIGYSIVPAYRRKGYGVEIAAALVQRAWRVPEVTRVIARTTADNVGSVAVLRRCGFALVEEEPGGGVLFELRRSQAT